MSPSPPCQCRQLPSITNDSVIHATVPVIRETYLVEYLGNVGVNYRYDNDSNDGDDPSQRSQRPALLFEWERWSVSATPGRTVNLDPLSSVSIPRSFSTPSTPRTVWDRDLTG